MTFRNTIARWLDPKMAREADRYTRLFGQITTEIWWLSEFPDVRNTLQRLLDTDRNHWRRPDEAHRSDLPDGISEFREMLRRRDPSTLSDAEAYAEFSRRYASAKTDRELARVLSGQLRQMEKRAKVANARADSTEANLARVLDANSRQASCFQQCAAAIGPGTAGTRDGLPLAVKHLVEQLRQAREGAADEKLVDDILQAVSDVIVDASVDYPAGREAGHRIDYDEEELRQRVAKLLSQLVNKPDAAAIIKKIADVSTAVGFQSGEPALEAAGQIVSVLAANPEHIDRFMAEGSELFIDGTFAPENGSLTYRSMGGDVLHPSALRKSKGIQQ